MSCCIWQWFYMGLGTNKMVKFFSFLFITVFFINNGRSQKLYIPVSNEEIIKVYTLGKKSSSGEYVYTDKDGNIRIKGKFNKNIPVGKWYLFYHDVEMSGQSNLRNVKYTEFTHNEDGTINPVKTYFGNDFKF